MDRVSIVGKILGLVGRQGKPDAFLPPGRRSQLQRRVLLLNCETVARIVHVLHPSALLRHLQDGFQADLRVQHLWSLLRLWVVIDERIVLGSILRDEWVWKIHQILCWGQVKLGLLDLVSRRWFAETVLGHRFE